MLCCIREPGDTDGGGLDIVMPVAGLIMGMALRVRVAAGWWSFRVDVWAENMGGTKGGDDELSRKPDATCCGRCVGECSGELLAKDDRSEDALWMDCMSLSVNKPGQNSMSSSRSNARPDSNFVRKEDTAPDSANSFMLRTPRKDLCEFCETDSLGALRFRPVWWL